MRIHSKPADFRIWVLNMKKERRLLRLWDARFLPYELCIAASLSAYVNFLFSFFFPFLSFLFLFPTRTSTIEAKCDRRGDRRLVPATLIGRFIWIT